MVRSGPCREIIGHLASVGWFDRVAIGAVTGSGAHLQGLAHGVHPHAVILDDHHLAQSATDEPGGRSAVAVVAGPASLGVRAKDAQQLQIIFEVSFGSSKRSRGFLSGFGGAPPLPTPPWIHDARDERLSQS